MEKYLHKPNAGGAAAMAGAVYQAEAAAYFAVQVLADQGAPSDWGLAPDVSFTAVSSETPHPVDDLLLATSDGGFVFVQVKTGVQVSSAPGGALARSFDQFVRQYLHSRSGAVPGPARDLDPARDRLVLLSGGTSPTPSRRLQRALDRVQVQGLSSPPGSANESQVREALLAVVTAAWSAHTRGPMSEADLLRFLSLVRFQWLEFGNAGADRERALALLRSDVLADRFQAEAAWSHLVREGFRMAQGRTGADRGALQRVLVGAGCPLVASPSYRRDIEQLRSHSRRVARRLSAHASIGTGTTDARIERQYGSRIHAAAADGPLVVTGQPGIGKSSALSAFIEAAHETGADVVVLNAGELNANSLGELRSELGLEHHLEDVLENWAGDGAFLVIDALDAARGEPAARTLRNLIRGATEAENRWTVVASVREFDLRYSEELQRLFRAPAGYSGEVYSGGTTPVRAVVVRPFSDLELQQLETLAPALHVAVTSVPSSVLELLRIPFNLRLAAELFDAGVDPGELRLVRTQIDLLDRYWRARVQDGFGLVREEVLRRLCEAMVRERALSLPKSRILGADLSAAPAIEELLRSDVLTEWGARDAVSAATDALGFSHHVLFDYAVARLVMRRGDSEFAAWLAREPEVALVFRPSLVLHLHRVWDSESTRAAFWNLVVRVAEFPGTTPIARITGPAVAADMAKELDDFAPLLNLLGGPEPADDILRHVVGALIAREGVAARPLEEVWAHLAQAISHQARPAVLGSLRVLLNYVSEHAGAWSEGAMAAAGQAARRLLNAAWAADPYESWFAADGIRAVCWSYPTDRSASAALLRRGLEPEHVRRHGVEEMRTYAGEVVRLSRADPILASDVYAAAFGYVEESEEVTTFGGGPVMSFRGTRRQDYRMAEYVLAKEFPAFLAIAPQAAVRGLVRAASSRFGRKYDLGELAKESFRFEDRVVRILHDRSHYWDTGYAAREDHLHELLGAFENAVARAEPAECAGLVQVLVQENTLAVMWRRLLRGGARASAATRRSLAALSWTKPLLAAEETAGAVHDFVSAVFPLLTPEERDRVQDAVVDLPTGFDGDERAFREERRSRLLLAIGRDALTRTSAVELASGETHGGWDLDGDEFEGGAVSSMRTDSYLARMGVPVAEPANQRILMLMGPLEEFSSAYLNDAPSEGAVAGVMPGIRGLREELEAAERNDAHPKQVAAGWDTLAAACACVARQRALECGDGAGAFVRTVLLESSAGIHPVVDQVAEAQFDSPHWGSPQARIEAASGLMALAKRSGCDSEDVLAAVERLSGDPVPAVRYQVAARAVWLAEIHPDLMWTIIERLSAQEQTSGVLQGLADGALDPLAGYRADRVADLAISILGRVGQGKGRADARQRFLVILAKQALWLGHPRASESLDSLLENPVTSAGDLAHVLGVVRATLTHGPLDPADPKADEVRSRGVRFYTRLAQVAVDGFREAADARPVGDTDRLVPLAHLLVSLGFEAYLASGAHDDLDRDSEGRRTPAQCRRFYVEAGAVIDTLSEAGLAPLTHHLTEALGASVAFDPLGVFLKLARVVEYGRRGSYEYDSLAEKTTVELVERYLADHRDIFRLSPVCRAALVDVLDTFVSVGWPRARQLTYRLEEIFR